MLRILSKASVSMAALLAAQGAFAQTSADDEGETERQIDTVIVTATKIATDIQDTPIAITAVTSEELKVRGLTTTADLGSIVPNARFRKSEGIYGPAVSLSLRGIAQVDPQLNGEPPAAYYIDDIYYPFLFGSQFDLLELDHVEVLRGPQGTLFGRNAIAGAINLVSRTPSLTDAGASIEITVGDYDRRDVRASFTAPLSDTLAIGAALVSKKRTGYQDMVDFTCQMYKNGTPELAGSFPFQTPATSYGGFREPETCVFDHLGGEDSRAVRGVLYWEPSDRVSATLTGDFLDQNDDIPAEHIFETNYADTTTRANFVTAADQFTVDPLQPFRWDERFETHDPYKTYDNFCDPFPAGTLIPGNSYYNGSIFKGGKCYGNTVPLQNRGVQGKVVVGLTDAIDFTAIGGWRALDLKFGAASDGTVLNDSIIYHEFFEEHWTGELRLTGQHDLLDWVTGVFYYAGEAEHLGQPQGVRAGTQRFQVDGYDPTALAGYANTVLHLFDGRLNFNAGVRYSDDKKDVDFNSLTDATPPGQTTFVPAGASTVFDITLATERWDWSVGADFKITDDVMIYASSASGYRLPGFNVRPSQPGQEEQTPGEALISYEVGSKSELFDRRLKINADVFLMEFTERPAGYAGQEAQLTDDLLHNVPGNFTVYPSGPPGTSFATAFSNCRPYDAVVDGPANPDAGIGVNCVARAFSYALEEGQLYGFEAEVEAEPIDRLLVDASFGFTQPSFENVTRSVPIRTASAGVQYEIPAGLLGGSITPRLDWFWSGRIPYSATNPAYDEDPYSVFNGRITYHNDAYDLDLSVGATNLFDEFYYQQKTIFRDLGLPTNLGQPAPPREWYVSVRKQF